jgi:hypothetical protein
MNTLAKTTLALITCFVLTSAAGQAGTVVWTGATNDWSLNTNWSPTTNPPLTTDLARFTTSGNTTPTLAAGSYTIQRINYNGNTNFNITGAGSANTTLTLDPNSAAGIAFIDSTAGTATNQTFSGLTVILNDSNAAGQVKLQTGDGKAFTFASDAKLQIGSSAAQAVILEAQGNGTGSGALTINGVLTGGVSGSSIKADTSGVLNLNLAAGSNLANLSLTTGVNGVINFVGGGDYSGTVNPVGGRVNLATSGITVGSTTGFVFGASGIIGTTYGSGTSTIAGTVGIVTGGVSTFDVGSGATLVLSNRLQTGNATTSTITKTGNGTLNLTYSGGTGNSFLASAFNVNVGTLLVNNTGSTTASSAPVYVASGATLGGAGRITGATTISGILAPGNSIGTLTVDANATWNGGASPTVATDWKFELGAGNTADLLNITIGTSAGEFLKGTGSAFRFDFQGSTAMGTFKLVDWASTVSLGGGALGTSFNIGDFSYTNLGSSHIGTFQFNGTQLEFVAVVPEPATWALLAFSLTTVVVLRRRRLQ